VYLTRIYILSIVVGCTGLGFVKEKGVV